MACTPLPTIVPPTLPLPLTIDPPDIAFSGDLGLCCKLIQFGITVITPVIPILQNAAVQASINAAAATVNTYIRLLQFHCPRE